MIKVGGRSYRLFRFIMLYYKIAYQIKQNKENQNIKDKVFRDDDIWVCGKCDTKNNLELDYCKNCNKEFNI